MISFNNVKNRYDDFLVKAKKAIRNFYIDFPTIVRNKWDEIKVKDLFQCFVVLLVVAVGCFFYSLVTHQFTIPLGGDFTIQGMTFIYNGYDDWHTFFEAGVFPQWDTSGFLGVSNIAANSFYYLFDPFFLILIVFPRAWLSQLQSIMMITKIILAGIFFYMYLDEFKISSSVKKMGAVAYAFSGWMMYYLWFFHFQEIATVFPLMLLGVEKIIKKRDPRMMIFSLAFMATINYFMFYSLIVLCFLYALYRFMQTAKNRNHDENWSVIGCGFVSFFTGVLLSGFILIPCIIADLNMPRATSSTYLADLLATEGILAKLKYMFTWTESTKYKVYYPFTSLLFMNDNCFSQALFSTSGYDNVGSSIYIFMPLVMMIIPSFVDVFKKKQWSQIIAFALVAFMVLTPFTYYILSAFVQAYGRWEIFVVAMLILFVCLHFDDAVKLPRYVLDISAVIVIGLSALVAYIALKVVADYSSLKELSKTAKYIIPCQLVWDVAIYVAMRLRFQKKSFKKDMIYVVGLEAIIMANVTIQAQITSNYSSLFIAHEGAQEQTRLIEELNNYDKSFYRIFNSKASRSDNNLAMYEDYNGISTFHSVYNFDTRDLVDWSRISYSYGNWSMGVHEKRYNLDSMLGVKYYLLEKGDVNIPYGYVDVTSLTDCPEKLKNLLYPTNPKAAYSLYYNTNFIDTFFAYSNYVSSDSFSYGNYENNNEINYLKKAIIDKEYYEKNQSDFSNFSRDIYEKMDKYEPKQYEVTYYRSNWDSTDVQNGGYRIYDPNMSNAEYLKQNPTTDTSINYNTPEYFFIYPGDTIAKYGEDVTYHNGAATEALNNVVGKVQTGLTYYSKIAVDFTTPFLGDALIRNGAYLSIMSKFGYNIDWYLYDENYKVITHDMHMWNGYSKTYDWKYARGFYVDRPVKKIVGVLKDNLANTTEIISKPYFEYEYNTEYQNDIDMLKDNAKDIKITSRTTDKINFKTSFDDSKIIVANIPYESGWSLRREYVNNENNVVESDVKLFKAQGGLLGFIGDKGEYNYVLSYETPGLKIGSVLTYTGAEIAAILFTIYFINAKYDKMYRNFYKKYSTKDL